MKYRPRDTRPPGRGTALLAAVVLLAAIAGFVAPAAHAGVPIPAQPTSCTYLQQCPPTSTTPPVTTRPPTNNGCVTLAATRICPTTTVPYTPTTKGGGAVIVLDGGTPITPPPTVTTPPAPDEARIQVSGYDFGGVQVGQKSGPKDLTVTNVGSIPVRYLSSSTEGPFAAVGSTCGGNGGVLNVKATCTLSVQYAPSGAGPQTGQVLVTVLAPVGNLTQPAPLVGVGLVSQIVIDPGTTDLGVVTLLDTLAPTALTVRNTGSGPARITDLAFAAKSKDFTLQAGACLGVTLAPGAACPFTVTAKPKATGAKSVLVVARGAAGEIARAGVKVSVLRTGLSIAPSPVDLGAALVATPAVSRDAVVRNTGQVTVSIAAVAVSGPQGAEFSIPVNGCAGKVLKPKGTCTLTVAGSPSQPGARTGTLTVTGGRKESAKTPVRMSGALPTTLTTAAPTTLPPAVTKPATTVPATAAPTTAPPTTPAPTTAAPTVAPTAPPTSAPSFTPTLVMRPAVGRPGGVTSAIGTGFPPNAIVQLSWEGDSLRRPVTADGSGSFALPVVLLPGERIGGRYMVAMEPVAYSGLRAPFLVQLPTFKPPGDSGRSGSLVGRG